MRPTKPTATRPDGFIESSGGREKRAPSRKNEASPRASSVMAGSAAATAPAAAWPLAAVPTDSTPSATTGAGTHPHRDKATVRGKPTKTAKPKTGTTTSARGAAASSTGGTSSAFRVDPQEICFPPHGGESVDARGTHAEARHRLETTLTLTNCTSEAQSVRVARPESRFFSLSAPKEVGNSLRVAAGLSVVYTVYFQPEDLEADYHTELRVLTEDGEFSVPVHAYSERGRLQLPAEFRLENCPVRGTVSRPLFLRNAPDSKACVWRATVLADSAGGTRGLVKSSPAAPVSSTASREQPCFTISPAFGTVPAGGGTLPTEVVFAPPAQCPAGTRVCATLRFFLGPEGDVVQDVVLSGTTTELPVALEQAELRFAGTYVTTERQAVVRVVNSSDSTVEFAWKTHFSDPSDVLMGETFLTATGSKASGDEADDLAQLSDGPFEDDAFSIEPASGVIYGRGTKEFTVTFNPHVAMPTSAIAYMDITGRGERLPLSLFGEGVGPQCKLEFSRLSIGQVYLNAEHEYTVELTNTGAIEASYTIPPAESELGRKFSFSPSSGVLQPGEAQVLHLTLKSDVMGVISEKFSIHLHGSLQELSLVVKGHVVGPSVVFDRDELDFGDASYGFWHTRSFHVTNDSEMPLRYRLRLSAPLDTTEGTRADCVDECNCVIEPSEGTLNPRQQVEVQVRMLASSYGEVKSSIVVDILDIGDSVDALPVRARCVAPKLYFSSRALQFGTCFVGRAYENHVEVVNDTALEGRFTVELVGDTETLNTQACVTLGSEEDERGEEHDAEAVRDSDRIVTQTALVIEPQQRVQVPVRVRATRPGAITFTIALRVDGDDLDHEKESVPPDADGAVGTEGNVAGLTKELPDGEAPEANAADETEVGEHGTVSAWTHSNASDHRTTLVSALACGPIVEIQPSTILSFGSAPVLTELTKTVTLSNTSPIAAEYSLYLESASAGRPYPVFRVTDTRGVIEPYATALVTVHACADEAMTFTDALMVEVIHSADSITPLALKVTGTGFPLVPDTDLSNFNFGDLFTDTQERREVTVYNKGRKDQEVQWQSARGSKPKDGPSTSVFHIHPDRCFIAPRESATFVLEAFSTEPGNFTEEFCLKQSSSFKEITRAKLSGVFMPPLLSYSTRSLSFDYVYQEEHDSPTTLKSFTVRNCTSKELRASFKVMDAASSPFSLDADASALTLAAGQTHVVGVLFDPTYRADKVPHEVKSKIRVSFANHPRQDTLTLAARLVYPQVVLDPATSSTLDFGVILKDTESRQTVTLVNPSSEVPAAFEWSVLSAGPTHSGGAGGVDVEGHASASEKDKPSASAPTQQTDEVASAATPSPARARAFDVVPFKGSIPPGGSQRVEMVFFGAAGAHKAVAQCRVAGGATVEVRLTGSAGDVNLRYDRQSLDFGSMPYYASEMKSITLLNPSQVQVAFQVALPTGLTSPNVIKVSPMSGVFQDKLKLNVTFSPVVPEEITEVFTVQVGHFDPQPITVTGRGLVNTVAVSALDQRATVTRDTDFNPAFKTALAALSQENAQERASGTAAQRRQHVDPRVPYAVRAARSSDASNVLEAYQSSGYQPSPVEVEAERLALCAALTSPAPDVSVSPAAEADPQSAGDDAVTGAAPQESSVSSLTAKRNRAAMKKFYQTETSDPLRRLMRRNSTTALFGGVVKFVLARYCVNFGHMTRHDVRTTTLRLTNTSADRVFLMLDSKELARTPLTVFPAKVPQLETMQSTTLELTLDAGSATMAANSPTDKKKPGASTKRREEPQPTIRPGENRYEFSLDVKNGPVVLITACCFIATPTLKVSESFLDFGKVRLGQAKTLPLTLRNEQCVPCEWKLTFKDHGGRDAAKKRNYGTSVRTSEPGVINGATDPLNPSPVAVQQQFFCNVEKGIVEANGSVTLDVFYAPFFNRKNEVTLTFRFLNNSKVQEVRCAGEVATLDVCVDSALVKMPVVRPQQAASATVTITNNEEFPVELYADGFDPINEEEFQILQRALSAAGVVAPTAPPAASAAAKNEEPHAPIPFASRLFLPPRLAGDPLPDTLLRAVYETVKSKGEAFAIPQVDAEVEALQLQALAAAALAAATHTGSSSGRGKGKQAKTASTAAGRRRASQEKGNAGGADLSRTSAIGGGASRMSTIGFEGTDSLRGKLPAARPVSVLMVGPPRSGKTTQASLLAERLDLARIDLDAVILAEAELDSANGEVIRNILTILAQHWQPEESSGPAPPRIPDELKDQKSILSEWLRTLVAKTPQLHAFLSRYEARKTSFATLTAENTSPSTNGQGRGPTGEESESAAALLAKYESYVPNILKSLLQREMGRVLESRRTAGVDCCGFVLDDAQCCLTANRRVVFDAIKEANAAADDFLVVISLGVSEPECGMRTAIQQEETCRQRTAVTVMEPLCEADYEALPAAERQAYNARLKYFNDCRREEQRAAKMRKEYAMQIAEGGHVSVQQDVEAELTASRMQQQQQQHLDGTASATRKAANKAPDTEVFDEPSNWAELGEMDSFRKLCELLHFREEAADVALPSGKKGAAGGAGGPAAKAAKARGAKANAGSSGAALSSMIQASPLYVKGDETIETVAENICTAVRERTLPDALTEAPSNVNGATVSPAVLSGPKDVGAATTKQGGQASSAEADPHRAATGAVLTDRGLGVPQLCWREAGQDVWSYWDASRLQALTPNHVDAHRYVKFLSLVQREVAPANNTTAGGASAKKSSGKGKSHPQGAQQQPESTRTLEPFTRWLLPAKSSLEVVVELHVDNVGSYSIPCSLGVVGSHQRLPLTVTAHAALPDVSREDKFIFPVCRAKTTAAPGKSAAKVFYTARRLFSFGPLLIPPQVQKRRRSDRGGVPSSPDTASIATASPATGASGAASPVRATTPQQSCGPDEEVLTFHNGGVAEAEVTLAFENEKERTFTVYPSVFTLPVGGREKVRLRACPEVLGEIENTLVAHVKDNPQPWKVSVSCVGSRPALTVNGTKSADVDFGRSQLNRATAMTLALANTSQLPVRWTLLGSEKLPPEISVAETSGVLAENATFDLRMTFYPTSTCLHSIPLQICVTDASLATPATAAAPGSTAVPGTNGGGSGSGRNLASTAYEVLPLTLKAEGHDVILEWTKEVDFRVMHVGDTKKEMFHILNKSPYDIGYMIRMPKRLRSMVTANPPSGVIRGMVGYKDAAMANVEMTALFEKEGEINAKLGQMELALYDTKENELVYPLQVVPVKGEAWHTRFAVRPSSIDFGSCFYDQQKQSTLEIRNTGRFPAQFVLFDYKEGCDHLIEKKPAAAADGAERSTMSTNAAAATNTKKSISAGAGNARSGGSRGESTGGDYRLGCFTVSPACGTVPVGESIILQVVTVPTANSRNRETLGVFVVRSHPEVEAKGVPVELTAHPATPGITGDLSSAADVETVFEEQQVVYRLGQLNGKAKGYGREERTFSFGAALVGHRAEERFRIANSSPLPCTVVAQVLSATGTGSENGVNPSPSGGKATGVGGGPLSRAEGFDLHADATAATVLTVPSIASDPAAPTGEPRRKGKASGGDSPGTGSPSSAAAPLPPGAVRLTLPPFESRFVTVGFTPSSLQRYDARFLAVVENGTDARTNTLTFQVCGNGTLPTVEYVLPSPLSTAGATAALTASKGLPTHGAPDGSAGSPSGPHRQSRLNSNAQSSKVPAHGAAGNTSSGAQGRRNVANGRSDSQGGDGAVSPDVIQMPLTRVGATTSRTFKVRNSGDIAADLRITVTSDDALANGLSFEKRDRDVSVPVGSEEEFEIRYSPTQVGTALMKLNVCLSDNLFEEKELTVKAQSFSQPVSFEGIDPMTTDLLDLGDCIPGQQREYTLTMRNNTTSRLRFDWSTAEATTTGGGPTTVEMIPSAGHIAPEMAKPIVVRVKVKDDVAGARSLLPCELHAQSIELLDEDLSALDGANEWDSSMMNQKWAVATANEDSVLPGTAGRPMSGLQAGTGRRNLRKVMEPVPEPDYQLTDEVSCVQSLRVMTTCDRPKYELVLDGKPATGPSSKAGDHNAAGGGHAFFTISSSSASQSTDPILFEKTKMFQRRIVKLVLRNTGMVTLPFEFHTRSLDDKVAAIMTDSDGDELREGDKTKRLSIASAPLTSALTVPTNPSGAEDKEEVLSSHGACSFQVEPAEGSVPVGSAKDISVVFSPHSTADASGVLVLDFPYSERPQLEIPLEGVGECPLVHFGIPPSSYLEQRVDGEAGQLEGPEPLVVEFLTRGLHSRSTVRFRVVNPTSAGYAYEWVEHSLAGGLSPFRCASRSGVIAAGKEVEMVFEFSADALGVREALWSFDIQGNSSIPFLLVGRTVEPDVLVSASKLNFGNVDVNSRAERVVFIENRDDVPCSFAFDKENLRSANDDGGANNNNNSAFLIVKPQSGMLGPRERLPVNVIFAPTDEMEYNVPLVCRIKKASCPLTINIKGEGVCTHESLQVEDATVRSPRSAASPAAAAPPLLAVKGKLLTVDLGRVAVDERVSRRFMLSNTGQCAFDYSVVAPPDRRFITLEQTQGTVAPQQRATIILTYHPTAEDSLRKYKLTVRISGSKVAYQIALQATTFVPKVLLGFDRYNFGPRFTSPYNPDREVSATLTLANNDQEPVTVDCGMSVEKADWCHLDSTSLVVNAGETRELKITFAPQEVGVYEDKLKLLLNGVYPVFVPIAGEGVEPRVEVLNHYAKLGVARVGERREVVVKMVCRSRIPTPVSFAECAGDADLAEKGILVAGGASQPLLLKPKEVRSITVVFAPTRRVGEFQREVKMLVCGREFPFVLLTGACQDSEVHLDTTSLKFDDVVVGSSATRRLVILNSGDISQKFSWNMRHGGELSVNPSTAFVRSHAEMACTFVFTPQRADSSFRREIEVSFDNSPPVIVRVEANAVARPQAKDCIAFQCRARETCTQTITVDNPNPVAPWVLEPSFDQPTLWHGPTEPVTVKPKGRAEFAITYTPTRQTEAAETDLGSLFLPQANGTGLTFTLEGHADAPGPSGPPQELDVDATEERDLTFQVQNWSNAPLRFTREVVWSPAPEDGLVTVQGANGLEVQAGGRKEYSLSVACMREGVYSGNVYFHCPERPDMVQHFEVLLRVSSQPRAVTVQLQSSVRACATHHIALSNPLAKAVTVQSKVELADGGGGGKESGGLAGVSDYFIVPASVVVPAKDTLSVPVHFFPLVHRVYQTVQLTLSSTELGTSTYNMKLSSSPGGGEKLTQVTCALGQSVTVPLRFTHFSRAACEFAVRVPASMSASLTLNRPAGSGAGAAGGGSSGTASAGAPSTASLKIPGSSGWPKGQEVVTEFTYEPQQIGMQKDTVEFVSPSAGTYSFPIAASCIEPQRQGPVAVKPGTQNTSIAFKNVFSEPLSVSLSTDNAAHFVVAKKTETIAPKKSVNINVQCKAPDDDTEVIRGKLFISCPAPPGRQQPLEWLYYLECNRGENGSAANRRTTLRRK